MRIVFDQALDGGGWPGPARRVGEAVCGEAWLGHRGMLVRLETELGLGGAEVEPAMRAAGVARALEGREGFWSRSLEADAVATARRLLADRDELMMWGWRGEAASARLGALWSACGGGAPGVPDRLRAVIAALGERETDLEEVQLLEARAALPPLWREAIAALEQRGVRIMEREIEAGIASGDLQAARAKGFDPNRDGSLVLLRPHGVSAAADEVAGALAARDGLDDVVIVTPDGLLDDALARHGVPRTGGPRPAPASAALVRLVLEAAFRPADPRALHDLVCAQPGPVPRRIAWRLVHALGQMPGRGTTHWRDALEKGLASLDDDRREPVRARLTTLLTPVAARGASLTRAEVATRLAVLSRWAAGRVEAIPSLAGTIAACGDLIERLTALGIERVDRRRLVRLCDEVEQASVRGPGEAGIPSVADPGALIGPASLVVWWGFTREAAPPRPRLRLSVEERAALERLGIAAPDLGGAMARAARRWRRPLLAATGTLILVCPQTTEGGEPAHPHPLWDELTAAMVDDKRAANLIWPRLDGSIAPRRRAAQPRTRPAPATEVAVGRALPLREKESPSSLEKLLGCSLAWTLHYHGEVRPGLGGGAGEPNAILFGTLAHHLLDLVFQGGALPPEAAAARATALVEERLPDLCELLALPDHQVERATVKQAIVESARGVAALIEQIGGQVRGTEVELDGMLGPVRVGGKADLLLAQPKVVIDFKWGGSTNRKLLENGAALQLAAYAELTREGGARSSIAYYVLSQQRLLAEPGSGLPDASVPGRFRAEAMWAAAARRVEQRIAELGTGRLHAPAAGGGEPGDSRLEGDVLQVAPGCRYCEHPVLCGRGGAR